jgi:hypothetical protein
VDQHPHDRGRNSTLRMIVLVGVLILAFAAVLIVVINR